MLGTAPEFVDNQHWFNTPGDRPLTLKGLRGRVVLIDFWTYSCINCLRTLPYLEAWDKRYRKDGLTIVGVHSPEFPFEKDAGNVAEAIQRNGIRYPVVQDNEPGDLERLGQPVLAGRVLRRRPRARFATAHFGEGEYGEKEHVIRELLAEAGHPPGRREAEGARDRALGRGEHAGDLPRRRPRRTLHQPDALARDATTSASRRRAGDDEFAYGGQVADRARLGDGARRRLARPRLRGAPRLPGARQRRRPSRIA